jgi:pimeloyl-ACP methyl ester carboxylesterase
VTDPIVVRRHGTKGPLVAVLHGGPGAPGSVGSLAAALADSFRVLEPLQRRRDDLPLTVARHVADLDDVLEEPVALVGWSFGAMLALSFAARHLDLVRSIALVGCGTYDTESRAACRRTMAERLGPERLEEVRRLDRLRAAATDRAERDRLLAEAGALASVAQAHDAVADDAWTTDVDADGHEETWRDVLRLQDEGLEPAVFASIRAPVRMFHGVADPHPGEETRDVLRRVIPHLGYEAFAECGHAPWLERRAREAFLRSLRAWLTWTAD